MIVRYDSNIWHYGSDDSDRSRPPRPRGRIRIKNIPEDTKRKDKKNQIRKIKRKIIDIESW